MPDKADAGNAPIGRSDPGKGPLGLSWLMWGVVAVGTFGVVWFLKRRSGTTQVGAQAGTDPGSGVTNTDPLTAQQLLSEMQDLATRLGASHISPAPGTPADPPAGASGTAPLSLYSYIGTTHTHGGTDISSLSDNTTLQHLAGTASTYLSSPLYRAPVDPGPVTPVKVVQTKVLNPVGRALVALAPQVFKAPTQEVTVVQQTAFNPIKARSTGNVAIE